MITCIRVCRCCGFCAAKSGFFIPLMLIIMTIQTQQLPIAAIRRIVVVVMISVMHRQFAQIGVGKFPCAASANPGVHF